MPRVFDLVECPDMGSKEIVRRFPEVGSGDFRLGSVLVVRESQSAVWFRDGRALDVFAPGRHVLTTANIPLLVDVVGAFFSGKSPFTAEVYFVNLRQFVDLKWGTSQPVTLRDSELGLVRLRAFGTYSMHVTDPRTFVMTVMGTRGLYDTEEISGFLRGIVITRLTDLLGSDHTTVLDLPEQLDELSESLRARVANDFAALGIQMRAMYIEAITPGEETQKAIEERAAMGAIGDLGAYLQFKAARALGDAAQRGGEGGGEAGSGVGLVAGLGLGGVLAGAVRQAFTPESALPRAAIPSPSTPDVACPACNAPNPAGAKFCADCGARIVSTVNCPTCNALLSPGARFCSSCGTRIGPALPG